MTWEAWEVALHWLNESLACTRRTSCSHSRSSNFADGSEETRTFPEVIQPLVSAAPLVSRPLLLHNTLRGAEHTALGMNNSSRLHFVRRFFTGALGSFWGRREQDRGAVLLGENDQCPPQPPCASAAVCQHALQITHVHFCALGAL